MRPSQRVLAAVVVAAMVVAACAPADPSPSGSDAATAVASATPGGTASPSAGASPTAAATLWTDVTATTIGETSEWSNKVELADLDLDGDVDILFANGGRYDTAGPPEPTRIFVNDGSAAFTDGSSDILGDPDNLARVVKVRDVDADGLPDIVIGTTYQTQTRLFRGRGGLTFEDVTSTHLPQVDLSVGDLELGDVDGDGDLDMILADWGPGNPMDGAAAPPRLWLNDGSGMFSEAPAASIPEVARGFSWDIEFVDVDGDLDLNVLESCKMCSGGLLLLNDGSGSFEDASDRLPAAPNNYEFEPMDINGDGLVDLVTINDGPGATERLLLGDGAGGFRDATADLWPSASNPSADDNVVVFLDAESDGDPDFLIGSLDGSDRLLRNDGTGRLTMESRVFDAVASVGTLGMAVADLDGDGRLDVVDAQGEVVNPDRVYLGTGIPVDTAPPAIALTESSDAVVTARVSDHTSNVATSLASVTIVDAAGAELPMRWYGEYLWRAARPGSGPVTVCAVDMAGNRTCSEPMGDPMTGV